MSNGCVLHLSDGDSKAIPTCSGCTDIHWGWDKCPNLRFKSELELADDARCAGQSYRARSGQTALTRDERVKRGRAFRKARKPKEER